MSSDHRLSASEPRTEKTDTSPFFPQTVKKRISDIPITTPPTFRRSNTTTFHDVARRRPRSITESRRRTLLETSSTRSGDLMLSSSHEHRLNMPPIGVPLLSRRGTLTGEVTLASSLVDTPNMTVMFDEDGRVDLDTMTMKDDDFNPDKFGSQLRGSGAIDTPVQIDPEAPVPSMNIVILLCGSRGDVQPFLAFGNYLKSKGHRVRIGTHDM